MAPLRDEVGDRRPTIRQRVAIACLLGIACGAASWLILKWAPPGKGQDFASLWLAARAIIAGKSPYRSVLTAAGEPLFFAPLTTALAAIPFTTMAVRVAGPVFVALSCGGLAYVATARAWWPLLMFLSGSMIVAVIAASFPILLAIGVFAPTLGWLGVFKPNVGLAMFAYRPTWRNALIMGLIGLASLAVQPSWPREWLETALSSPFHFAPWRVPGGFIVLLAVLRWRLPEGRLLATLALVPSSPIAYEALPLFVIPRNRNEMLVLATTTNIVVALVAPISLQGDRLRYLSVAQPAMLWLVYVPALVMVLRRRNKGDVHSRLERLAARAPSWLRGEADSQRIHCDDADDRTKPVSTR